MKKMFSLVLALVMMLALATTAFAANPGSITLENAIDDTYTAYKVFDVTYNADKTTYAYSISGDSEWYDTVKDYAGITLTKAASENTYKVETTDSFSAPEFANLLKADTTKSAPIAMTKADGKATVDGLELGYYFVESAQGALCNLTTTKPAATIYDKNEVVFEKTDDKASVDVGEVVSYIITGKVPDTTGFESYTYVIADTMSSGLTFQKDVTVKVDGELLAAGLYTLTNSDTGFTLSIDVMDIQDKVTKEIKVEYTALVNENAIAKVEKNSATLTYSNDPTKDSTKDTMPNEETVWSSEIVIDKFVGNAKDDTDLSGAKLPGASFKLYKVVDGEKKFYKWNDADKKVEWVAEDAADVVTTDANGAGEFEGLANGTYYLLETVAPDGYNLLDAPVKVVIAGSDTSTDLSYEKPVANFTGLELPSTGGVGTTIFYTVGGVMMAAAFVLFITKKKMANEQ